MASKGVHAGPVRGYRDLRVWQNAMDLVVEVYRISAAFPRHETYGLTSQLRKAAVSVPANIAEGHGRDHIGDYLYHLSVANGSLMELETHVLIAERLAYVPEAQVCHALRGSSDVGRMLSGLTRSLKRRRATDTGHRAPDTYSVRNATIGSTRLARRAGK